MDSSAGRGAGAVRRRRGGDMECEARVRFLAPSASVARIASLDGLRALSIAMVLYAHLFGADNFIEREVRTNLGELGVRVFFVISGYLISTLLFSEMAETGTLSVRGFY